MSGWRRSAAPPTERVRCARCPARFVRLVGATYTDCLACQTATRLRDAGITHDDPALVTVRAWNAGAQRKAGIPTTEGHAA